MNEYLEIQVFIYQKEYNTIILISYIYSSLLKNAYSSIELSVFVSFNTGSDPCLEAFTCSPL